MTPAQYRVLRLRAEGLTIKAIAARLGISDQTVKNHMTGAYHWLDADNIVTAMQRMGWVRLPDTIPEPAVPVMPVALDVPFRAEREPGTVGSHQGGRPMTPTEPRAPVQKDRRRNQPGTVPWATHLLAWQGYDAAGHGHGPSGQSAERIAERGGFSYAELQCAIAGHYNLVASCRTMHPVPDGWEPR